jgi:PKD domain-containing protein
MPSRLACGALLLVAACARHVAPAPGEDRTVVSGVPVVFGSDQDLPKGTRVVWDFGDGTPPAEGARVEHAFPRAGAYRVTETVVDADGQKRSAGAKVTVLRRPVPAAVPADVRAAWVQERPWERVNVHRATAAKLALSDVFDETAAELSDALGFEALDAGAAQEHGFDPDEGLALFTVPQDPEALVAAVGTSDDAKALTAVKRLLSRASEGRFAGGPFQLTDTRTQNGVAVLLGAGRGGEQVAVVLRYGYLYLRLPGLTDPTLALRGAIALPPSGGLAADPAWQLALQHVGQGDAVFFSRPSEKDRQGRFATQLGLAAFSLLDGAEALQMKLFAQPRRLSGEELQKTFTPLKPPPDLAARLPKGPAAYMKLSGRPDALWRELLKASQADANRARERAEELTGLDLEKDLLPAFTGNFGIALYLDAAALLEAVLGEEVSAFDRSGFLVAAELAPERARTLQQAIDRKVSPAQRVPIGGTTLWKLGGGAAMAAVKDGFFYFAVGGLPQDEEEPEPAPPPRRGRGSRRRAPPLPRPSRLGPIGLALAPEPGARTLSDQLKEAGVSGFDSPRDQVGWFDVQGLLRSLQAAAEGEGGMVSTGARMVADRMAALRDALLLARPVPEGVDASLSLRFRRDRGRTPAGGPEGGSPR